MSTRFLPSVLLNASSEIEDLASSSAFRPLAFEEYERIWDAYRVLGVSGLYLTGSVECFRVSLQKSALALIHFLQSGYEQEPALSRLNPVSDAMACRSSRHVQTLHSLLADVYFKRDLEYEEDHLYFKCLMNLSVFPDHIAETNTLLERIEAVAAAMVPRAALCRAILNRDADAFAEALLSILEAHKEHYANLLSLGALKEEAWVANGQICIEAVALLAIADGAGLSLSERHLWGVPFAIEKIVDRPSQPSDWLAPVI